MASVVGDPLFIALRESGRFTGDQLAEIEAAFAEAGADPARLAERLLQLGALTRYQFRKIQSGRFFELLFGDYFILSKIGEGGMGKVYQAAQRRLGRMVALKVVRSQLLNNKTVMKRYEREAHAAQQLDHPNIVKLLDAGEVQGKYFLAMEFVDGSDLSRLVKEFGPLPYPEAAEYTRQAALGLQHAHDLKFVHRDIKPSNLLVFGTRPAVGALWNCTVKILDMGLVRSTEDESDGQTELTRMGTVVGTPDYMSPEQGRNSSEVDARSDLYSLGCTLFCLLSGKPPFPKGTPLDRLLAHQIDPVPNVREGRPEIPPMLADIVARLMRKRPEERFARADELARALEPFTPQSITLDPNTPWQDMQETSTAPGSGSPRMTAAALTPSDTSLRGASGRSPLTGVGASTPTTGQKSTRSVQGPASATPKRQAAVPQAIPIRSSDSPVAENPAPDSPEQSSRSHPGRKKRVVKQSSGFPIWALISALTVGGLLLLAVAFLLARSRTASDSTPASLIAASIPTSPAKPVATPDKTRTVAEFIPDHATAVLVYRPKPYFEKALPELPAANPTRLVLELLTRRYNLDLRQMDRGVLSFGSSARQWTLANEGSHITATCQPGWDKFRSKTEAGPNGSTLIHFGGVNAPLSGVTESLRGAHLPTPPAFLLGPESSEFSTLTARAAGDRAGPTGVSSQLLQTLHRLEQDKDPPLLNFVAASSYPLPSGHAFSVETLGKHGVDLLHISIRLDGKFKLEMVLHGSDENRLREFVAQGLPGRFEDWYTELKPMAEAFTSAMPLVEKHPHGYRLRVAAQWEFDVAQTALDQSLSRLSPLAKKVKD